MKVVAAPKKRPGCKYCTMVVRRGYIFVTCSNTPKHKQRQG